MKLCPNPDCPSHQQQRKFKDTDVICAQCGHTLYDPGLAGGGTVPPDAYVAYAATPSAAAVRRNTVSSELALLGAAGTLLLAFLLVALMIALGWIQRGGAPPGTPVAGVPGTAVPTLAVSPGTAVAQATLSVP